ncbi:hypothetical protein BJX64DRAFT_97315 [Aspergillus heterothallicus]
MGRGSFANFPPTFPHRPCGFVDFAFSCCSDRKGKGVKPRMPGHRFQETGLDQRERSKSARPGTLLCSAARHVAVLASYHSTMVAKAMQTSKKASITSTHVPPEEPSRYTIQLDGASDPVLRSQGSDRPDAGNSKSGLHDAEDVLLVQIAQVYLVFIILSHALPLMVSKSPDVKSATAVTWSSDFTKVEFSMPRAKRKTTPQKNYCYFGNVKARGVLSPSSGVHYRSHSREFSIV